MLEPGTVVTARVLAMLEQNLARIAIAGTTLDVPTQTPLTAGTTLQLAVSGDAQGVRLAVVSAQTAETGTTQAPAAASALPSPSSPAASRPPPLVAAQASAAARQTSLAPLFADVAAVAAAPTLPADIRTAAAQLAALPLPLDETVSAETLRAGFAASGILLEAKQAAGLPASPATDLKSALTALRDVLQRFVASLPEADAPAAPPASAPPASRPTIPASAAAPGNPAAPSTASSPVVANTATPLPATPRPPAPGAGQAPTLSAPALPPAGATPAPPGNPAAGAPSAPAQPSASSPSQALPPSSGATAPPSAGQTAAGVSQPVSAGAGPAPAQTLAALARDPAAIPLPVLRLVEEKTGLPPDRARALLAALAQTTQSGSADTDGAPARLLAQLLGQRPDPAGPGAAKASPAPGTADPGARAAPASTAAVPPPYPGDDFSAQPVASPSLAPDDPAPTLAHRLLDEVDAGLARQTLLQLASLPEAPRGPDALRWNFEIPFATPQGTAMAQFEIAGEGGGQSGPGTKDRIWSARFTVTLEPAGPVHARIVLAGERTSVRLWADRAPTNAALRAHAGELTEALRAASLEPGQLSVGEGAAAPPPEPRPGRYLDRAT